jgi:hypothetical protein
VPQVDYYELRARAILDLAEDNWIPSISRPHVSLNGQQALFRIDRWHEFQVSRTTYSPAWQDDSKVGLNFDLEDPIETPFLGDVGVFWCTPCHALLTYQRHVLATISGFLTFESWTEEDDFKGAFELWYPDQCPLIVALGCSQGFDRQRDQAALENAARLVLGIDIGDSSQLLDAMDTPAPDEDDG